MENIISLSDVASFVSVIHMTDDAKQIFACVADAQLVQRKMAGQLGQVFVKLTKHVLTAQFACIIDIQFWNWSLPSVTDIVAEPGAALQEPCTLSKTVRQFLYKMQQHSKGWKAGPQQGVRGCVLLPTQHPS